MESHSLNIEDVLSQKEINANKALCNLCVLDVASSAVQLVIWIYFYVRTENPLYFVCSLESIALFVLCLQMVRKLESSSSVDVTNTTLFVNLFMGGFILLFSFATILKNIPFEDLNLSYAIFLVFSSGVFLWQKMNTLKQEGMNEKFANLYRTQNIISWMMYAALFMSSMYGAVANDGMQEYTINRQILFVYGGAQLVYLAERLR